MEVAKEETAKYGIVAGEMLDDRLMQVSGLVEKPDPAKAPSRLAIPGRYILPQDIFSILESTKPSVGGEIQLTDALNELAKKVPMFAYRFHGQRFDAGDRFGYLEANLHYALKRSDLAERVEKLLQGYRSGGRAMKRLVFSLGLLAVFFSATANAYVPP